MSLAEPDAEFPLETTAESQLRDLFAFSAGSYLFAVFAEEVEGTASLKTPASLPLAPAAVLGVVCVRGRMLTVLDPVAVTSGEKIEWPSALPCVIGLLGDEQLGLAAESIGEPFTVAAGDIEPAAADGEGDQAANVIVGIARHAGHQVIILNTGNLFMSAVQRKERRRRRF